MNFGKLSIGGKIVAITLGVVVLGVGSLTLLLGENRKREARDEMRERSLVLAHTVAQYAIGPLVFEDEEGARAILDALEEQSNVRSAVLCDARGRTFATFTRTTSPPHACRRHGEGSSLHDATLEVWVNVVDAGQRIGSLELSISTDRLLARQRQMTMASLRIAALLVLVCAGLVLWLRRFVTQPLAELGDTMQGIAESGELGTRVTHHRKDELGRIYDIFNTMMDEIATRQRAREASERRLRTLVEALPDLVVIVDRHGAVIELPKPDELRLSSDGITATGRSIDDLLDATAASAVHVAIERAALTSRSQHVAFELGPESARQHFDAIVNPMSASPEPSGEGALFVLVARDVTDTEKLHAQLQQAQKMEAVGQLAGGVAHDFNNLLAGILGYTEAIARKPDAPARQRYLEEIVAICQRAADLNANLLAFSRRSPSRMAPIDLHHTIDRVVGIISHSFDRRIEVCVELGATHSMVVGDPSQLESALLNLAVNARDAMPEGGTLRFTSREVELDELELGALPNPLPRGRYIEIGVSDTGTGIPDHVRERMFEPFFTTKEMGKGSGLGLAAVYGTAQSHQGLIRVYSQLGQGTVFRLYFPIVNLDVAAPSPARDAVPAEGAGLILVVDDEDYIRETTKLVLESLGYEVVAKSGGPEALATFRERHHEIAAVVLDMMMPVMTGAEVADEMAKIDPAVPVVIASGFDLTGGRRPLVRAAAFLQKPYVRAEVASTVATVIARASSERAVALTTN